MPRRPDGSVPVRTCIGCGERRMQDLLIRIVRRADGSLVPVNLSVNPSLTITALAEWVMSNIEPKQPTPSD